MQATKLETRIRDLAYHIWEREGRPDGRALDHWIQAEVQLSARGRGKKKAAVAGAEPAPRSEAGSARVRPTRKASASPRGAGTRRPPAQD